jgi:hypothetical protein
LPEVHRSGCGRTGCGWTVTTGKPVPVPAAGTKVVVAEGRVAAVFVADEDELLTDVVD